MKKRRPLISLVLILFTLFLASYYLIKHKYLISQLVHTPPLISLSILGLYALMFGVLMLILSSSLRICRLNIADSENAELNARSLFINYFMPGQGGPLYRGLYLNKCHKLKIKNFLAVTLLYYVIYLVVSISLLLIANRPWWQTFLAVSLILLVGISVIRFSSTRGKLKGTKLSLNPKALMYLVIATIVQAIVQTTIYAVELHSVNSHIHISQILTYTGAANLTLFVALTPGAIGIREAFLIFTEHLHHISSANIVVANVIDRSVYLTFLILLLAITIAIQFRGKLQLRKLPLLIQQTVSVKPVVASASKITKV